MKTFTSAEFMTAEEKTKVLKDWKKFMQFLASGEYLKWNDKQNGSDYGMEAPKEFSKRLYNHLSLHCGFIAHYNIHGFYSEYFSGEQSDLEMFFRNFEMTDYGSYNSSSAWGDYVDLGEAMTDSYLEVKDKIFSQAEDVEEDKFELIQALVKRAETDLELRRKVVEKFL